MRAVGKMRRLAVVAMLVAGGMMQAALVFESSHPANRLAQEPGWKSSGGAVG